MYTINGRFLLIFFILICFCCSDKLAVCVCDNFYVSPITKRSWRFVRSRLVFFLLFCFVFSFPWKVSRSSFRDEEGENFALIGVVVLTVVVNERIYVTVPHEPDALCDSFFILIW